MKKWEYKLLNAYSLGSYAPINDGLLDPELKRLGEEGWEAYGVKYPIYYFKRPKVNEEAGWAPLEDPFIKMLHERETQSQKLCQNAKGPYSEIRGLPLKG